MSDNQKMCVLCGRSCAGQARIKNARGQYAHRACVEARQAREQAAEELGYGDALGGDMDELLGDLALAEAGAEAESDAAASACPGCGMRMVDGARVCMECGFNTQTGKAMRTRRREAKPGKAEAPRESKLAELGDGIVGLGMKPIYPLIGAAIGGLIGAGIWAAIAYTTRLEFSLVAILVGTLCGLGARMGGDAETTGGGMIAGIMAAGMAILSIGAGKYVALSLIFEKEYGGSPFTMQTMNIYDMDDDGVYADMAFEVCRLKIDAGEDVGWEDQTLPLQLSQWPDDYPESFQDEVYAYWDTMSDADQLLYRRDIANDNDLGSYRDVDVEWALQVLADELAYTKIGSGEVIEWPDPHLYNRAAQWPDDYPGAIRDQVQTEWAAMNPEAQRARRQQAVDAHNESVAAVNSIASGFTYAMVIESFKSPLQVLFSLFAIWWAYRVGNSDD